jgi:glycosyltransferase involved in cell wall biosynthesis
VGAEGLHLTDGVHALVADSPADFAEAVARALDDTRLADALGEGGRRLVEEHYSWRSVQDKAVALVSATVR